MTWYKLHDETYTVGKYANDAEYQIFLAKTDFEFSRMKYSTSRLYNGNYGTIGYYKIDSSKNRPDNLSDYKILFQHEVLIDGIQEVQTNEPLQIKTGEYLHMILFGYNSEIDIQLGGSFPNNPYLEIAYGTQFGAFTSKSYPNMPDESDYSKIYQVHANYKIIFEFDAGPLSQKSFLIQSENTIKKFSNSWEDIGVAPVTNQMFNEHGMVRVDNIPDNQWEKISSNSKILAFNNTNQKITASITNHNLYNTSDNSYHGTGVINTEMEKLPLKRKSLMVNADHQGCSFRYSLDNGLTWHNAPLEEMIDLSQQEGTELVIEVNLPTDNATLTAISYAWA